MSEKDAMIAAFLRAVRARMGSAGTLAEFAGVGRAHLSSMLNGDTARGAFTWKKIRRHVTAAEWAILEKSPAWSAFYRECPIYASQAVKQVPTVDDPADPLMQIACSDCGHALKLVKCTPGMGGKLSHGFCAGCYTARMKPYLPADEITAKLAAFAAADAADPSVIPLRPIESGELALS